MLVLSRKEGEGLITSNGVRIVVIYLKGNRVGIGVQAAQDIEVIREELMPPGYDPGNIDPKMVQDVVQQRLMNGRELKT